MWYLVVALIVAASSVRAAHHAVPIMCHGNAYYNITFYGMWSEATHAGNVPNTSMFSPASAASHSSEYEMWRPHTLASDAVKQVAETGSNELLKTELELEQEKKKVHDTYFGAGPMDAMGHADTESLVFTPTHHFGSFVSMVFPSPDWFVGIYNIDLCGSDTGKWMKKRSINLYAWDAGTDSGKDFESADDPTDPVDEVTLLMPGSDADSAFNGFSKIPKFATITLELAHVKYEKKECMAMSKETYHVHFEGMWTNESHPRVPMPGTAQFSPVVVASHNEDYVMWKPGMAVSEGVKKVAEQGPPDVLLQELKDAECLGVKDFTSAAAPIATMGSVDLYIDVDQYHPFISAVAMIFPSPDWFVGISWINLCDWCFWNDDTIELALQPWDAGTDDGAEFESDNAATTPPGVVSLITTDQMSGSALGSFYNRLRQHIKPLATITIERKMDAERDYKNLVLAWKKSFEQYKMEMEKWKEEECMSSD